MGQALTDRRTLALLLGVTAVGALFAPLRGGVLPMDSYWYLDHAMRVWQQGIPEGLLVRRPLFPALIAATFGVLGPTVQNAFVLSRVFFVANLCLVYLLGTVLGGRVAGVLGAFFVLTSFTVNFWSSKILVDHVIVTLLLVFLLLLHQALTGGKRRWYAAAGAVLGLAFLTKEVIAIPFLGLPFLMLFDRSVRSRRTTVGAALLVAACAAILAPLAVALAGRPDGMRTLLGPFWSLFQDPHYALPEAAAESVEDAGTSVRSIVLWGLDAFFRRQLPLWPLLAAAAGAALYRAVRHAHYPSRLLLGALAMTAPIFYLSASRHLRPGQLLVSYVVLFLLLALAAGDVLAWARGLRRRRRVATAAAGAALAGVCAVQVLAAGADAASFASLVQCERGQGSCFTFWRGRTRMHGASDDYAAAMVRFGLANLAPGERVAALRPYLDAVPFYSRERIATVSFENTPITPRTLAGLRAKGRKPGRLLHLTGSAGVLWGQYEEPLLELINKGRVRYLMYTFGPYAMRSAYFRTHPDLRRVRSLAGGSLQIYRVMRRPVRPSPRAETRIGPELYQLLRSTIKRGPEARAGLERTLGELLDWPPARVAEMVELAVAGKRLEFEERYTRDPVR